jgi:hypothetical protein
MSNQRDQLNIILSFFNDATDVGFENNFSSNFFIITNINAKFKDSTFVWMTIKSLGIQG